MDQRKVEPTEPHLLQHVCYEFHNIHEQYVMKFCLVLFHSESGWVHCRLKWISGQIDGFNQLP